MVSGHSVEENPIPQQSKKAARGGQRASEPLESTSKAPAAEVAASSCLRRAAALAGLGLELWGEKQQRIKKNT